MADYEGNERWRKIREYAMGKIDVSRFKETLKSSHSQNNYIKIDWSPVKSVRKIMRKLLNSPKLKNHRMIARLFRITRKTKRQ